jgi:polysaccharide biosynthesis/export protein
MVRGKILNAGAISRGSILLFSLLGFLALTGCATGDAPPATVPDSATDYRIGPGDSLQIFVWQNKDLSTTAPVRPDGRLSLPLVNDIQAAGKTPSELSKNIEASLSKFVKDPVVTVIVASFEGANTQQVRIVGEASRPEAIPYHANMSVLDAMIHAGGLTTYAAGNRATLIRTVNGVQTSYGLRLDDLLKDGDMSANAPLAPGDVILIPQVYF